ncbi:hypothetical protein [Streptomyces murinus]|uniref:hypothetical protein n=1 Tax=Streptomyces murinus TaxID=33900 RepID=UPI003F4863E2
MPAPAEGGDAVDWDVLRAETGWRLPADYRDFVAVYGPGTISGTLAWATNEAADDFLWRCAGEPDQWKVTFRPRERHREYTYDMGMAEFLLRLVRGGIHPPLGAQLSLPARFESWRASLL